MFGRTLETSASSTARCMVGWMIRCASGISTFCWRCKSDNSSSANFFFVTGIPMRSACTLYIEHYKPYKKADVPILPSPSLPPPLAPTKASNHGFTAPLSNECKLSYGVSSSPNKLIMCSCAAKGVNGSRVGPRLMKATIVT